MAPAVGAPTIGKTSGAASSAAASSRAAEPGRRPARAGQRRAVLRAVPDTPGVPFAKLPLLERPLASYYLLGSSAGLLLLLGLVMVLSASNVRSFADFGSSYTVFLRQATWMGIGLPILLVASRTPVRLFRRAAYPLLAVTLLMLLLVLSPLGVSSNGAQRWVGFGPLTLQPSELAKLALVLWSADLLTRKRRLLGDWKHLIIPIVPVTVFVGGLIMLQPDMGTTIIAFSVLFVALWVVGTPGRVYGALLGVIALVATVLAVIEPYRLARLLSYRDPFDDAQGSGWQAVHGIYALASGGWWGEGLGASREKWPDLLPAPYTDFILAILGEELGLLGCLVVVTLFGVFGYAGLRVAHRTDNHFVRLAAAASTGWILAQAVVNMGAVVGLLPITGIPLPLVSFGGSSLVPTMFSIGMLLAFARSEPAAARLLAERAEARKAARRARRGRRGADGAAGPKRARFSIHRAGRSGPGPRAGGSGRAASGRATSGRVTSDRAPSGRATSDRATPSRAASDRAASKRATSGRRDADERGPRGGRDQSGRDQKGGTAGRARPHGREPGDRAETGAEPGPARARPRARPRAGEGGAREARAARGGAGRQGTARQAGAARDTGGAARGRRSPEPGPYHRPRSGPDGPPAAG
ncbi:putative lipid II flippase FtsW [Frankia sp. CN6]|uniref:Probable peptidoglycan glycosyltransferase FtsW n=2 Tax=Frankia nepalensis TaxID=1836974 RepID=A0A937RB57_9ACTN|nr:putative lipid II flippase FtsW [Frankia nepalensis]